MADREYNIDKQIILKAQAGDEEAIKSIVSECEAMVKMLASKQASFNSVSLEDLTQDGFYYLVKAINSYDINEGRAKFSTFAYTCVKNGLIDAVRKYSQSDNGTQVNLEAISSTLADGKSMEDEILSRIYAENLMDTIKGNLKPLEYQIITLIAQRTSYVDIAERTGLSLKQVDGALQRIRKKLKKIIK